MGFCDCCFETLSFNAFHFRFLFHSRYQQSLQLLPGPSLRILYSRKVLLMYVYYKMCKGKFRFGVFYKRFSSGGLIIELVFVKADALNHKRRKCCRIL